MKLVAQGLGFETSFRRLVRWAHAPVGSTRYEGEGDDDVNGHVDGDVVLMRSLLSLILKRPPFLDFPHSLSPRKHPDLVPSSYRRPRIA